MRILFPIIVFFTFCSSISMDDSSLGAETYDYTTMPKQYACMFGYCKKFFTSDALRKIHQESHTVVHTCCIEGCKKVYEKKYKLQAHILRKHAIIHQIIECIHDKCGKIFLEFDDLIMHMKQKHAGNTPSNEALIHVSAKRPRSLSFTDEDMADAEAQKKYKYMESGSDDLVEIGVTVSTDSSYLEPAIKYGTCEELICFLPDYGEMPKTP